MTDPVWLSLAAAFFVIAILYASVGFGGGSSYTALLAVAGITTVWIPVLSLSCNLIVVAGGVWHFSRRGHLPGRLVGPFLITSVPAAYAAGRIQLPPSVYLTLLGLCLLIVAGLLLFRPRAADDEVRRCPLTASLGVGAALGALSGLVGIGGGIFLAPILLMTRWATPRQSAAAASVFIFVNSLAGLAGQLTKPGTADALEPLPVLAVAVLLGGQIGSRLGADILRPAVIRQGTAVLVLVVAVRLVMKGGCL